ncbi:2-oxoglutarate dehydrogenase complex dihydrolipoyllysine-residue succinyltransferase [Bartonella sp. DGB1]|uniref:2-oxoglutarate dehydrogenase complex dihydrolipoyllysine-residue succinyltransferase n=1 Tax=Bartonella sp. DGB1 TaxID=3239807 RepID=UPI003524AA26
MTIEIKVPALGESVTEATIGKYFKKVGDFINIDEPIVELETDKVTVEVPSPVSGVLQSLALNEGDTVAVGALLAVVAEGESSQADAANIVKETVPEPAVATASSSEIMSPSPAAKKLMVENNLDQNQISGSGKRGQILKGDILSSLANVHSAPPTTAAAPERVSPPQEDNIREERVRMTKLRQTIARRLKEAQNTAAMLTTFNEVDMSAVMNLRKKYKDIFEKKHGVKLGFMGFFTRAVCHALNEIPAVNAEIDGTDIIYKNFAHIGVAVGTEKGLVVPVVRNADQMSIAEIEKEIGRLGRAARDGKLSMADMQGGSFTISNGGVYGSLMSTPILNAPQSGILGMHKIQERPVVMNGQIVIRPMMYLALSYDHRIVDGQEAVTFLVRVKESLEDPERLVLDL